MVYIRLKIMKIQQYVKKITELLDIQIYTPYEAFEHGINAGIDWNDDKLQEAINERDELQRQVITLENEVNHLDGKINELKEKYKWISVNDKLPEKWVDILAWYDDEIITAQLTDDNKWCNKSITYFIHSDDVTHWQPLPEPPTL